MLADPRDPATDSSRVLTSAATDAASYSEGGWPRSGWHTEHISIGVATADNGLPFE